MKVPVADLNTPAATRNRAASMAFARRRLVAPLPALSRLHGRAALTHMHCSSSSGGAAVAEPQEPESSSSHEDSTAARAVNTGNGRTPAAPLAPVTEEVLGRNAELAQRLRGKLILAPLTKGGNVPFRRLCSDYGAEATMSEMAFARNLLKGDRVEAARLKKAVNEACFGFQFATNNIDEGVRVAQRAAESGASWVDLNCGCPIYEATRRGLGAVLLRKPAKLARLVAGIAAASPLPLTVKIRTGESEKKINVQQVVEALAGTGAAAVTVHGRTMQQRYTKAADWGLIGEQTANPEAAGLPIIGNGDILTYYEARSRMEASGVHALMVGRGALVKPWVFQEYAQGRAMEPDARERVGIYRQLVSHMREHFGDDDIGRRKAWYFLPWHFEWFCRYRPFPEAVFAEHAARHPLIATRWDTALEELGEDLDSLPLLERLLRCDSALAHEQIAAALWDAASDDEAAAHLLRLADANLAEWEAEAKGGGRGESGGKEEVAVQGTGLTVYFTVTSPQFRL